MFALVKRCALSQWRDVKYNVARFVIFVLQSVVFGVVFRELRRTDFASMQSTLGVICLIAGFPCAMSILTTSAIVLRGRGAFYRETASNTYSAALFPLAHFLVEIPTTAFMLLASYPVSYFIVRFEPTAAAFFQFWFAGFLLVMMAIAFGLLITFMLPSHQVMLIFFGLSQNFWWLFNSVFVSYPTLPAGWRWFFQITPYNHAVSSMAISQFKGSTTMVNFAGEMRNEEDVLRSEWGYKSSEQWLQCLITIVFIGFFLMLSMLASRVIRHVK